MLRFRRRPDQDPDVRITLMDEIAQLWQKTRVALLGAPLFLLLGGWGAGHLTNRALALPEDADVRPAGSVRVPRVHMDALSSRLDGVRAKGVSTADIVSFYRSDVEPVERVLRRRGVKDGTARAVAWPLVEHSSQNRLDLAMVISVMFNESNGRPDATSSVGARGLMQVMPAWSGYWKHCGRNLYDIDANLCNGTSILAYYLKQHRGDTRRALLGYNGCVRGTTTPNCHTYPDKIERLRRQITVELAAAKNEPRPGIAASR